MDDASPASCPAWRIPSTEELLARQKRRWQAWLAVIACGAAVVFSMQAEQLTAGLIAVAVIALFTAYRLGQPLPAQRPNVRLDAAGFHWENDLSAENRTEHLTIPRGEVRAFRIESAESEGPEQLILILRDQFDSQPIALAGDIEAEVIRNYLRNEWSLEEMPSPVSSVSPAITVRLPIYSECHPEQRAWHLEGSTEAILGFAGALRKAAAELPPPPLGAQAKALEILGERRSDSYVLVERTRGGGGWFEDDIISGSSEFLQDLARAVENKAREEGSPREIETATADGRWTMTLHVKPDAKEPSR